MGCDIPGGQRLLLSIFWSTTSHQPQCDVIMLEVSDRWLRCFCAQYNPPLTPFPPNIFICYQTKHIEMNKLFFSFFFFSFSLGHLYPFLPWVSGIRTCRNEKSEKVAFQPTSTPNKPTAIKQEDTRASLTMMRQSQKQILLKFKFSTDGDFKNNVVGLGSRMIWVDPTPKRKAWSGPNFKNRKLSNNNNNILLGKTFYLPSVRKKIERKDFPSLSSPTLGALGLYQFIPKLCVGVNDHG